MIKQQLYQELKHVLCLLALTIILMGCSEDKIINQKRTVSSTTFEVKDPSITKVDFTNTVKDRMDFNILNYRNFYNGGGVAIGDINNDGLPDLYFTSNLEANKLYINKGGFVFEDITTRAGVKGVKSWSTGVTMVDVNADGFLDIYVCNSGNIDGSNKENELFINQKDLTFKESAKEYGLNNKGYSTQAAFFDYDADGDLDCYLLNNSFKDPSKIELYKSMRDEPDELGGDKLYRNDGGVFTDVSIASGIYTSAIGFGLGTCIGDLNQDNLPDIYVSNDFWERDYLYMNQGDGTFSEELIERIDFCSISSMGGDIADINNDGHPEIISTDMLAADNYRLKAVTSFDPYHLENIKYRANYHYQIGQNCLHVNNGEGYFQEVGMMANVAATDWSWGALFFDFENDGAEDIFISNGVQRDLMYLDFRDFMMDQGLYAKMLKKETIDYTGLIEKMPSSPLSNYGLSNSGALKFENKSKALGLDKPSFSNGAAYGDLDNDGDLDLVVNNINEAAFIYENKAERTGNNYLKVKFTGDKENPFGIGAKVRFTTQKGIHLKENYITKGYQSSLEPILIFGVGTATEIENLEVIWPDGKTQIIATQPINQEVTLDYSEAKTSYKKPIERSKQFEEVSASKLQGDRFCKENGYNDFDHERLLLSMLSKEGPRMIKGDLNGDKLDDIIVLGAKNDPDKLFLQDETGKLSQKNISHFTGTKEFESSCGVLFDKDQDGDLDLMLGAGGNESADGGKYYILRYFTNDGKGNLTVDNSTIPQIIGNFSCIEASDIDGDGDQDLFLGARVVPGNYGLQPRSFLLLNDADGWIDISTEDIAGAGMVTDAVWADVNGDSIEDLIVVGDWMAVKIFINQKGQLLPPKEIPNSSGWWNRVVASDLDDDGDLDFVLGNRGLNTKFQASKDKPLTMNVADFDNNGKAEFIVNWYPPSESKAYPFASKMDLVSQLPFLKKKILKNEDYANQDYETLFDSTVKSDALSYKTEMLESAILWNDGGAFDLEPLPREAQVSPIYGISIADFNKDGIKDIWLGGNLYSLQPQVGRHDASKGLLLEGLSGKKYLARPPIETGISVDGEVRDAVVLNLGEKQSLLVSRNNASLLMFQKK